MGLANRLKLLPKRGTKGLNLEPVWYDLSKKLQGVRDEIETDSVFIGFDHFAWRLFLHVFD